MNFRLVRISLLLVFILLTVMLNWELSRLQSYIPDQAIRFRVLANSDSMVDQALKQQVRKAVIQAMDPWVTQVKSKKQEQALIRQHMPELNQTVDQVLRANRMSYGQKVELAQVAFPSKGFGNTVYPAGNYEALRITLGKGEGHNFWCVLYPALGYKVSKNQPEKSQKHTTTQHNEVKVRSYIYDKMLEVYQRM
jgi:stage II sporulation protein R